MDSSLPVLVSRLPDRGALTRLVRAALRHEVAAVELASGPQRAEAHTLDLHVAGQPPLALLAEPAGAPHNGQFPLRLRPLYRAQAAQLYAILEAENVPLDGPIETVPLPADPVPPTEVFPRTLDLGQNNGTRRPSGAFGVETQPLRTYPAPPPDPEHTPPPNETAPMLPPLPRVDDPRRTAPSAVFTLPEGDSEAAADDPSLSVSVVFEPDAVPEEVRAASYPAAEDEAYAPADVEEPSLSVSVVFEPDAVPATLLENVPSPLGAIDTPEDVPVVTDRAVGHLVHEAEPPPPSDVPGSGNTIATAAGESFFDEALASFPHPELEDSAPDVGAGGAGSEGAGSEGAGSEDAGSEGAGSEGAGSEDSGPEVSVDEGEGEDVSVDEVELLDEPAPTAAEATPWDDDDDATLVRVGGAPVAVAPFEMPPGMAASALETQVELPSPPGGASGASGASDEPELPLPVPAKKGSTGGRKKKSTRRKAKDGRKKTDSGTDVAIAVPARPDESPIGRRIAEGKYAIESLIGSGAAGAVYRATHRELRRTVAIKLLHPHYQQDPHFMTSFRAEALAASQLDHPNVMRVLDFGQEPDGLVYIVMEYLSGRTLQSLLDEERRLPTERAVEIMIQVCAALSVAHDHGIIHRDIKPDNIMLVPSRNDEGTTFELVKVCDFGIAALQNPRAEDAELKVDEHIIAGTPEYMSPEQARGGKIDARADVYACGICLYELVTGRPPFLGENAAEILIKQLEELPRPPSQVIKGLDPIVEEVILRAVQKDPTKRHQSAREMRVELKELIEPGEGYGADDRDELSIVENVAVLDDPASGFPGFFIAFSSAVLRFGRFERGHTEAAQAMKELQKALRSALRGRTELTFARRDTQKQIGFCVMSGTAEIVDLKRLLGSQLMGSFGDPFIQELVKKGIAALTLREGLPDTELHYIIEMLLGPYTGDVLQKELLSKPLRHLSVLFVSDVVGRDRKLSWKVGLCASRLARDLRALCNVRGISLKKMRETREELIGGVARLLTRGEEVKQFIFNSDLVDDAVANLRGFSSFQVAPLIVERVLHESCAEAATLLLGDYDTAQDDQEELKPVLGMFAARLVTERSPRSDAAIGEFHRRGLIDEGDMPRDLRESIRAQALADALVREPSQFLLTLDLISDPSQYAQELGTLEAAMSTLARRAEAVALLAVMSTLARHAKNPGKPGPRENAALRTMKTMLDKQRLLPIANTLLVGPPHQREAARQLIVLAGSVGALALYAARESTLDPSARATFVKVLRDTGPAGWTLLAQILPRMEVRDDAELAIVEDLLRAMPDRADNVLGDAVAKFLAHPILRPAALSAIVPLWGERARKPLVEALEYAEEPTRIIALAELRRLRAIDEYVFNVVERILTMRGIAGEEVRAAAGAALADVAAPLRVRAVALLSKAVEGKRGIVAMLRGNDVGDESILVLEAMSRALLTLDRNEGVRALKSRLSRTEGVAKARLAAILQMG